MEQMSGILHIVCVGTSTSPGSDLMINKNGLQMLINYFDEKKYEYDHISIDTFCLGAIEEDRLADKIEIFSKGKRIFANVKHYVQFWTSDKFCYHGIIFYGCNNMWVLFNIRSLEARETKNIEQNAIINMHNLKISTYDRLLPNGIMVFYENSERSGVSRKLKRFGIDTNFYLHANQIQHMMCDIPFWCFDKNFNFDEEFSKYFHIKFSNFGIIYTKK
jgi:hypothetical protein